MVRAQASRSLVVLSLLSAVLLGTCGGGGDNGVPEGAPKEVSDFAKEWPAPNGDLANRRVATSDIDTFSPAMKPTMSWWCAPFFCPAPELRDERRVACGAACVWACDCDWAWMIARVLALRTRVR